jgi:hypothetical protein
MSSSAEGGYPDAGESNVDAYRGDDFSIPLMGVGKQIEQFPMMSA